MAPLFQLCVIVLAQYVTVSHQKGTTADLEKIFKRRCLDYTLTKSVSLVSVPGVDCDELWIHFTSVWKDRQPCKGPIFSYRQLFNNLAETLPKDKVLFWSGTKAFAQRLSNNGRRYVTLEETLIGHIADGLTWCGQTSGSGINYNTCPEYGSCEAEPVKNFWQDASRWFASHAAGEVTVVLDGSNPSREAYNKKSIFRSVEVPSLQSTYVTRLKAIVVHYLDKSKRESCMSESLLDLRSDIQAKDITFECSVQEVNTAVALGHFKPGSTWDQLTCHSSGYTSDDLFHCL